MLVFMTVFCKYFTCVINDSAVMLMAVCAALPVCKVGFGLKITAAIYQRCAENGRTVKKCRWITADLCSQYIIIETTVKTSMYYI